MARHNNEPRKLSLPIRMTKEERLLYRLMFLQGGAILLSVILIIIELVRR